MLEEIGKKLAEKGLVKSTWNDEMTTRGGLVTLYREYYEGKHRADLTTEMKEMLRVNDSRTDTFNINYCQMVVNSMADRLVVEAVEPVNPQPTSATPPPNPLPTSGEGGLTSAAPDDAEDWAAEVLKQNRFDALQIDVREAALRDGDTFVMVQHSDDSGLPVLAHELAWDGDFGMMVVYDSQEKHIAAGVKVWWENDSRRVNIYYPNSIERYKVSETEEGGGTQLISIDDEAEDTTRFDDEPGVPIVHFKNKAGKTRGSSELVNVIPLQDSLNRTLVSMVMTSELTAFQLRWAKGFNGPAQTRPGDWINFGKPDDVALLAALDIGVIEQASLVPFINQASFVIEQIGTITHTPMPWQMGADTSSGEALKQREIGLLGKVSRAHVQYGNAWEDVLAMAHRFQTLFGHDKPPEVGGWNTRWADAQVRNDMEILAKASWYHDKGFEREALRLMGKTADEIEKLMKEKTEDSAIRVAGVPAFGLGGQTNGVLN